MVHTTEPNAEIDLQPLRDILQRDFQPGDYQEAQELIVGACQEAQSLYGWVSPSAAQVIADHLGVTINRIYGLLTFYADFRTEPPGKHSMLLCYGAACFVMGADKLVQSIRTQPGLDDDGRTSDGEFGVQIVNGCLGVCNLAPVVQIDHHHYFGHLNAEKLQAAMRAVERGESLEDIDAAE
ncbi:MAG TPA: NAD(P)H-dependent oxidoreductase subunit E [Thermomicrobiaceae bacterium]|nr:NAD(P)H-dependent oxidoreductase subunit E [Thermomicrobiaceae bacterium]